MDRDAGRVRWSLYRDATCSETACLLGGSLPLNLVQPPRSQSALNAKSTSCPLDPTGIQLIPELQQRVWDLLERKRNDKGKSGHDSTNMSDNAVPIAVDALSLGSRAAEWGLQDGSTMLYCKLQLDGEEAEAPSSGQAPDWFTWKLARAGEYRARGNEAFKHESYSAAVRLYKRALAWLEAPAPRSDETLDTKIAYSTDELQIVNPVAVACYANMATCYSKLDGDGDVDRCVAAATSALELDDSHVKARYRRSQAYVASKEFDNALADLIVLRGVDPDNKLFRSALSRAQTAKTQLRKKQQTMFANLFDR
ncbi:hypothetical protein PRIC2_006369 [Phytophthora ramorum]|uniref:Peptidyl-prolyl cis-trans isomerase D n=1 Tax=Phytophthora ramorum TaxID=164328 RepID=UPI0030A11E58|nr:Peptidyl-prolyl cis-trans isomerase D [Phytophthora ramorum]